MRGLRGGVSMRHGVQTERSEARKREVLDIIRHDGPIGAWNIAQRMGISYSHVLQFLTAIDNERLALLAEDDAGKVFILDKEGL